MNIHSYKNKENIDSIFRFNLFYTGTENTQNNIMKNQTLKASKRGSNQEDLLILQKGSNKHRYTTS